jgi:hypothetical protein
VCCKKYNTHEFYAVNENEIYLYSYGPSEKTLWFKVYHYGIQPIVHDIELVKLLDARRRKLMDDTKPARIVELPSVVMLMNKLMPKIGDVLTVLGDSTLGWAPASGNVPLPTGNHTVYVAKGGDDTTGDGSLAAPYLTINHAYSTISSATTTDRWAINVGPGRFDETGDIVVKPWIWLIGTQRTATRVTSSTNVVRLDSAFTNGNYRLGMMNILFFGSTNVNFDLQALGDSGSTVFESDSMYVNNIFTFKGRTTADFVEIWNSQILANCNFYSLQGLMKNCYCGGDILVTDLGGTENIYFDVIDTYYNGNFTITQTLNNVFICKLLNSNINGGTLALTSTGTLNIGADAPSLPANVTTSDVLTLTRATPATSVGYVPAVPANWAGTAPATIQAAIDRLAAQVSVLGGVPVP